MSVFFQNNKTAIHIASEVVIFGIAMFVIYRKTNGISEDVRVLEERITGMEKAFEEQRKIIHKLQTHINRLQTVPQNYYSPPPPPPSVQTFKSQPSMMRNYPQEGPPPVVQQEVRSSGGGDQSRVPLGGVIYINQVQSPMPTAEVASLSTIEEVDDENEEDEIDKSIQRELEELKKSEI